MGTRCGRAVFRYIYHVPRRVENCVKILIIGSVIFFAQAGAFAETVFLVVRSDKVFRMAAVVRITEKPGIILYCPGPGAAG